MQFAAVFYKIKSLFVVNSFIGITRYMGSNTHLKARPNTTESLMGEKGHLITHTVMIKGDGTLHVDIMGRKLTAMTTPELGNIERLPRSTSSSSRER